MNCQLRKELLPNINILRDPCIYPYIISLQNLKLAVSWLIDTSYTYMLRHYYRISECRLVSRMRYR
jgi:hypothetical protein